LFIVDYEIYPSFGCIMSKRTAWHILLRGAGRQISQAQTRLDAGPKQLKALSSYRRPDFKWIGFCDYFKISGKNPVGTLKSTRAPTSMCALPVITGP
jgi:hypothetical protein